MSVQKSRHSMPDHSGDKITIENINVPGYTHQVDAAKYNAMHRAILKALPTSAPGLTQLEIRQAVLPYLPSDLFPNGNKAGCVG